jgi:hypothetical protein
MHRSINREKIMPGFPPYSEEDLQFYLSGLGKGFLLPDIQIPDIVVPEEHAAAYSKGISDGESYGANGYPVDSVCYDLNEPHSYLGTAAEAADFAVELYGIGHTLAAKAWIAAGFEAGLLALMFSIAMPHHYQIPTTVVDPSAAYDLVQTLTNVADPLSVELYFGGGIDYDAAGCQLSMSRIYKSLAWARDEIAAMGRPAGMILSLRTDMSGGPSVVEEWGQIFD